LVYFQVQAAEKLVAGATEKLTDYRHIIKDGSGLVFGSASFGFSGFGGSFLSTVFGFGASKPIGFGFGFGFPPVEISKINHLELKFIFYNMIIIIYLLRLLNLFKVNS